ncbi:hypothetical protein [Christiangramia forsetii]|uniref:Membrane protein n=2 Tax=Christiangramia forsetii TaxID=411153 RepID=A0M738_CHRFK|nr:hypothetical protein [Christiangramia forsetii]GGG28789.1 hypothetical protein GCM10011532_10320 [Christiangramia forsetii]CAL68433.1 membrane protein [Christiangramia forsetii KT0803]
MKKILNYKSEITEKNPENLENDDFEENEITEILPELYSKRVITAFSLIFSTIFGAVILMSNLKKKGEKRGRIQVLIFSIIYTTGMIITIHSLATTNLTIPLNILGAIILNEYFWNRYLGKDIEFEKKSWLKPAIISVTVIIPFIVALFYA